MTPAAVKWQAPLPRSPGLRWLCARLSLCSPASPVALCGGCLPASLSPINHGCRIYFLQQFISASAIWVCPQVGRRLCCCQSHGARLYRQADRHDLPAPPQQTPGLAEPWAGTLGTQGSAPSPYHHNLKVLSRRGDPVYPTFCTGSLLPLPKLSD